jgi:hypothetical protein
MIDAIVQRLPRMLQLEGSVHGEIARDPAATGQAVLVTIVASLIGSLLNDGGFFQNVLGAVIFAPIGLFIWTGITFAIGRLFGGTASYSELVRPVGYAGAPFALGIIPVVGSLAGSVYSAVIQIKTHQEVNGLSQGAAIAVVLIPLVLFIGLVVFLAVAVGFALFGAFAGAAQG